MSFKFFIVFIVLFSSSVKAGCEVRSTTELINKAEFIVEGIVKETNFKPVQLKSCQLPKQIVKKVLKYKVNVTQSLKSELPPGDYSLSYEYTCNEHPENPVFEEGKTVILAVASAKSQVLTLVGTTCDWWGWDDSEKPLITKFLKAPKTSK